MPDKKQIALYIDVDNCDITYDGFIHAIMALQEKGEIIIAKVYGVSERKNKDIFDEIARRGYEVAPPMRIKKRGQKILDNRIIIDIMEDVLQNTNIEAVAVIVPPADMVYLYRRLQSYNIAVYAVDNNDEESSRLVDEFLDVGLVETIKPTPKKKPVKTEQEKPAPKEKPQQVEKNTEKETQPQYKPENEKLSYEVFDEPSHAAAADAKKQEYHQKQTAADRQMAGEFASMLKKIQESEKAQQQKSFDIEDDDVIDPSDLEPMPNEEKYTPVDNDKILEDVADLEEESTPLDDENAALLEEIKKLLEEFKSE